MGETRGRKPKPAHLLKKYSPDRRPEAIPQATGDPVRPTHLTAEGFELWDTVVPELVELNIVGHLDTPQLVAMCEWWQEYRYWAKEIPDHKNVQAKAKAYQQFLSVSAKFGLTPHDRRKIKPRAPKEVVSPFAQFLAAKQQLNNGVVG